MSPRLMNAAGSIARAGFEPIARLTSFSGSSVTPRSEEHTSELQSQSNLVCRLLLEKKNIKSLLFIVLLMQSNRLMLIIGLSVFTHSLWLTPACAALVLYPLLYVMIFTVLVV